MDERIPAPETLPAGAEFDQNFHGPQKTLADVFQLPHANIWSPTKLTFPTQMGPDQNEVIRCAFSLASKALTDSVALSGFAPQCEPRSIHVSRKIVADWPTTISSTIIAGHVTTWLPDVVVVDFPQIEQGEREAYMATVFGQDGAPDRIEVNSKSCWTVIKKFLQLCITTTDETHKLWLSVLFAIKLLHSIGHILMFRVGYGGTRTSTGDVPNAPPGLLMGDAGYAYEINTFGGYFRHIREKGEWTTIHGVVLREHGRAWTLPIDWFQSLVTPAFWAAATQRGDLTPDLTTSSQIMNTRRFHFDTVPAYLEVFGAVKKDKDVGVVGRKRLAAGLEVFWPGVDKRVGRPSAALAGSSK
ncbi:hypothetical protein HK104_004828 [Borealophlyctis nickersoniae]|nr:hypothetical protein HK104_004828 [Borealophlyctis nickersoniae]